jgi:ankyrin repeat protein
MMTYDHFARKRVVEGSNAEMTDRALDLFDAVKRNNVPDVQTALGECDAEEILFEHENSRTCLMTAAELGFTEIVQLLVESANSPVDQVNARGRTALHLACSEGKIASVTLLLDLGAVINKPDTVGRTPLMYASLWGFRDIVKLLLERGADVHMKDVSGATAMSVAKNDLTRRILGDHICGLPFT